MRWSVTLEAPPGAAPVVAGEVLVVPLFEAGLSAHRLRDGSRIWTAGITATQPLAGDLERVYVAVGATLHALAADSGQPAWQVPLGGPASAAPLAHAGWVIVTAADELVALRAADGAIVWRQSVGPIEFRPSLEGDLLVVSIADGNVAAFDVSSGARQWQIDLGARPAEPLVAGGRVYVGTEDKWFYALHAEHGRRDWRWAGVLVRGRPATDDRHIYLTGMDNVLRALDRRRGALRWSHGLPYRPAAGPVVTNGGVIVPGRVEALPLFGRSDGTRLGQIQFAAALTALPVFSVQEDGLPRVFATLGGLLGQWTVTLIEASHVPLLRVTPLKELPGEIVPGPQPPQSRGDVTPLEALPGEVVPSPKPPQPPAGVTPPAG